MRILFVAIILCIALSGTTAQKSLSIKAGTAYSDIKNIDPDFGKSLGYYAGLLYQDKINEVLTVMGDLHFLNQRLTVEDQTLAVYSINFTMGVNLYIPNTGFHFIIGPEIGNDLGFRFEGEKIDSEKLFRFSYVGGLGYSFDRIGIQARYVGAIDHQQSFFDYNIQLGLTYKIF